MAKVRPYIGTAATWFVGQAAHIGRFMVHCALMLVFSALLSGAVNRSRTSPFCNPSGRRSRCRRTAGGTGYPRGGAGCGGDGVAYRQCLAVLASPYPASYATLLTVLIHPLLPCPASPLAGTDSGNYLALLDRRYHLGNGVVSVERCGSGTLWITSSAQCLIGPCGFIYR